MTSITHIVTFGALLIVVFHLLNTPVHINYPDMAELCPLFTLAV